MSYAAQKIRRTVALTTGFVAIAFELVLGTTAPHFVAPIAARFRSITQELLRHTAPFARAARRVAVALERGKGWAGTVLLIAAVRADVLSIAHLFLRHVASSCFKQACIEV